MARMRPITALSVEHIGLHVLVVDGGTKLGGLLTFLEPVEATVLTAHPTRWMIEVGGTGHTASGSATWRRQFRLRDVHQVGESAWQSALWFVPRLAGRTISKLFDGI